MSKENLDHFIFSDTVEFNDRTPVQDFLFDVITMIDKRVLAFYLNPESKKYDIRPHEMLVMVTANLFSNLAQNIIYPCDATTKLQAFDLMNEELTTLNKKLFMTLEAYYNADEKTVN